jgi:enoyl-CoA hydratase
MVTAYQDIVVTRAGEVEILTINRPEVRNALRFQTYDELEHAVRSTAARCLVITGADPAFCSGDDVRAVMVEGSSEVTRSEPRLTPLADALLSTDVPVVAAVRFGELFVLRGLCSDVVGLGRLAGLVGRERAAELLFTGEVIDAGRARDIGLVSRVVPHDQLGPAAQELAARIAANPPLAVRKLKEGLRRALDPDWHELGRWVTGSLHELFRTEDHREGVAAFLERRPPSYTGR